MGLNDLTLYPKVLGTNYCNTPALMHLGQPGSNNLILIFETMKRYLY